MKILYIISAYKCPDLLIRLVTRLDSANSCFVVHVDKKTDDAVFNKMHNGLCKFPNLVFLKRHTSDWGGFGHVAATIGGIDEALRRNMDFDYLFLLTGQDYPIKSNQYIDEFLRTNSGKEFLAYFPVPAGPGHRWDNERGGLDRIDTWNFRMFNRAVRLPRNSAKTDSKVKSLISLILRRVIPKRKFPQGFKPFGGPGYWCITRGCVEYIKNFIKKNPEFVKYFKYVHISDEIFFHTIIMNSPFKDSVINDDLRCIDWTTPGPERTLPRIWRKEDLATLRQSNALIARKFDNTVDSEILNLIDSDVLQIASPTKSLSDD